MIRPPPLGGDHDRRKTTSRTRKWTFTVRLGGPPRSFFEADRTQELFLLGTQDRVFERFCRREPQPGTRGNLDGLTRRGVTAHACLGLAFAKDSESRQAQGPFFLELSHHEVGQLLERALRLLLGHTDLVGEMGCYLRLRHHPPPYAARLRGHGVSVTN